MSHVDVSVVLPARDAAATVSEALESILGQQGMGAMEVAVAVPPDDDETRTVVRQFAARDRRVRLVDNPSGSTPAALNAAIRATCGPIVVRCDAHAVLPPDYVATAVASIHEHDAGNVGGRQVPTAEGGFAAAVAAAMRSPLGSGGAVYRSGTRAMEAETVYLGVFRREALDDVGGFDERLHRNQDYELNHRLRQAGWPVWFDPRLAVAYRPRGTVGALARQYRDYGRFKRLVVREHPGSIRPRQLAPLVMAAGVAGSVLVGVAASSAWIPALVAGGYLGLVVAGGVVADARRPGQVAVALTTMHWAWAIGFLEGPRARGRRHE